MSTLVAALTVSFASVASTTFPDRIDAKPPVRYATRTDGCFDLFDRSGLHPQSGTALPQVTGDVVERARRFDEPTAVAPLRRSPGEQRKVVRDATESAFLKSPPAVATSEPDPKARDVDDAVLQSGAKAVGFRGAPSIAREVIHRLSQLLAVSAFEPSSYADGLFEQALICRGEVLRLTWRSA